MGNLEKLSIAAARIVVVATLLVGMAGCSLFHDDYPDRSCNTDVDCFRAQGETCNLATRTCESAPDAAPRPDAPPTPDAAPAPDADTTPDATPADASGVVD